MRTIPPAPRCRLLYCGPLFLLLGLSHPTVAQEASDSGAPVELDAVSVMGASPDDVRDITGSAHQVDQETLERDEYDNIHRVLQRVPGVYIRGEDGYGLRPNIGLRGTTTERSQKITLLEDRILIAPAPYAAPAAYYFPMTSRMVGVEVVKGPGAIAHGPATVGGAVNLQTRRIPLSTAFGVDAALGTDEYGKVEAHYGDTAGNVGWLIDGVHLESGGFKELDGGGDTGFSKNSVMVKGNWTPDPMAAVYQEFEVKLGYADERSNETYLGLSDEDFGARPFRRYAASQEGEMDTQHLQGELRHRLEFGPDRTLSTTLYRHDFDRNWTKLRALPFRTDRSALEILNAPDAGLNRNLIAVLRGEKDSAIDQETLLVGNFDRAFYAQGIQTRLQWAARLAGLDHDFEFGLRYHEDQVERNHTEDAFLMQDGRMVRNDDPRVPFTVNREEADALAGYVRDTARLGKLTVDAGVRVESIDYVSRDALTGTRIETSNTVVLPGAGAFYQVQPTWGILAGVHSGFVPTGPGEGDAVDAEKSLNFEAGFRYLDNPNRFEVVGFFNDYRNLTGTCTISSGCAGARGQTFNGGEVDIYGLEALLAYEWSPAGGWRVPVRATYTFTETEFQSSFESDFSLWLEVQEGDRLPYMPRHQGSLSVGLATEAWDLTTNLAYVGEQLEQAGQGDDASDGPLGDDTVDARVVVDLVGRYRFGRRTTVYAKVDNVFDNEYLLSRRPFGARPGKPRTVIGGVKYAF